MTGNYDGRYPHSYGYLAQAVHGFINGRINGAALRDALNHTEAVVCGDRPPALRLLDAMADRGVHGITYYPTVDAVPWDTLTSFPYSRGERLLIDLADGWAHGHRPEIAPVLAAVDHAYQTVLADCLDMLPVAR